MESLKKIHKFILDTLFPINCLNCGERDAWLCQRCLSEIPSISSQVCPYCEREITTYGQICSQCKLSFLKKREIIPLETLITATKYQERNISRLIHLFKYNFIEDLAEPLGKIIIKSLLENSLPLADLIIPVPLHPRRLRWRGFNQSELLARCISQNLTPGLEIPVLTDAVKRIKFTPPQMKIKSYARRKANLKEAFVFVGSRDDIKNKVILLIDDVSTTGATLFECAKTLKLHGAKKVFGVVVARQEVK